MKRNGTEVLQPPAYRLTDRPGRLTSRPVCLYLRLCVLCLSIRLVSILSVSVFAYPVHLSSVSVFAYRPSFLCLSVRLSSILRLSQHFPVLWRLISSVPDPSFISQFTFPSIQLLLLSLFTLVCTNNPSVPCLSVCLSSISAFT